MKNYKINFENLEWVIVGKGARYKCYQDGNTRTRLIEFTKELEHPEWCLKGHVAYVIEGSLEMEFATGVEKYESGNIFIIPEGEEHKHIPKPLSPIVKLFSVEKI